MLRRFYVPWAACAGAGLLASGIAWAQTFPQKSIRVVTAAPGANIDFAARLLAQGLATRLGQQVVVDNRGGSSIVAAEVILKSPPDGHTLLFYGSALWLAPFLQDNLPYDPVADFAPVTLAVSSPNVLVVHPSLPVKTAGDLIALAKKRPNALNYGSSSIGSSTHMAAELFKMMAGVQIVHVPYKGNAAALVDVVSGQIQIIFSTIAGLGTHVQSGRLRALAVTSAEPSPLYPGVPTVSATGLPGYEAASINGLFAPAKTPAAAVRRINQEAVATLGQPDVREKLFKAGLQTVGSSPEELGEKVKSEMARLGKVIKAAGIRAN
jgi:tripartite-type tricarboxylate transporter receptor subunit TctC